MNTEPIHFQLMSLTHVRSPAWTITYIGCSNDPDPKSHKTHNRIQLTDGHQIWELHGLGGLWHLNYNPDLQESSEFITQWEAASLEEAISILYLFLHCDHLKPCF